MRTQADDFEEALLAGCHAAGLASNAARVVLACSGGADSTALLFGMAALAPAHGWDLAVAHLDHGLRPASVYDQAFVRERAAALGLPFYTARVRVSDTPAWAVTSPEDAARRVRRAFLRRVAREVGADYVALGHNADDQAETALLNAVRGAGSRGLAAMPAAAGVFIRPMLAVTRDDVSRYLRRRGLTFRFDETNRDVDIKRNWVRRCLFPALEGLLPAVRGLWRGLAAAAALEEAAAETATAAALAGGLTPLRSGVRIGIGFLRSAPPASQMRAVRRAFAWLTGSVAALERRHVETVVALRPGGAVALPRGVYVKRDEEGLLFTREKGQPRLLDWEIKVTVPGRTAAPSLGWEITATEEEAPPTLEGRGWEEVWLEPVWGSDLTARRRRPGDRVNPVGFSGTRKIQDVFVNAKVAAAARDRWPIIWARGRVVWVPGLVVGSGAAATPGAKAIRLVARGLKR